MAMIIGRSKIGVTATRDGGTEAQLATARALLRYHAYPGSELHEGHCIGGDEQLSELAKEYGYEVHAHPGVGINGVDKNRSANGAGHYDRIYPELPHLERNKIIVDLSDFIMAMPKQFDEQFRGSGTWHAIRYARSVGKRLVIIWPDGSASGENL